MQKLFRIDQIKPNHYRNPEKYPIKEAKIEALLASFARTGYWGNIVGREIPGGVELAYGMHRLVAMQRSMKPSDEVAIIVQKISDEDMLRFMADENMNEWGHDAEIEQETVRAVVEAYARGDITDMPEVPEKTNTSILRCAPGFRRGHAATDCCRIYTDLTVALFLSKGKIDNIYVYKGDRDGRMMPSRRVSNALAALEAIEECLVDPEDLKGLTSDQAEVVASNATHIKNSYEKVAKATGNGTLKGKGRSKAKKVVKKVVGKLRKSKEEGTEYGVRGVRHEMQKARLRLEKPKLLELDDFVLKLSKELRNMLGTKDVRRKKLEEVIKVRENLKPGSIKNLTVALNQLIRNCQFLIEKLENSPSKTIELAKGAM